MGGPADGEFIETAFDYAEFVESEAAKGCVFMDDEDGEQGQIEAARVERPQA